MPSVSSGKGKISWSCQEMSEGFGEEADWRI